MNSSPEPRVLRPGRRTRVQRLDYEPIESFFALESLPEPVTVLNEDMAVDMAASVEAAINAGFREGFEAGRAEGVRTGAVEGRDMARTELDAQARASAE